MSEEENGILNDPSKMVGAFAKFLIVSVVLVFLGLQSLSFFEYIFPADQWYLSYLGFGLTSGGVVLYFLIFNYDAKTKLQQLIAVIMLLVSVVGEVLTAGFGMNIEAMTKAGFELSKADFDFMVLAVQGLGFVHGIANLVYLSGDKIVSVFQNVNSKGKKTKKNKQQKQNHNQKLAPQHSDTPQEKLGPKE